MTTAVIVQARMGSTRLPGKVMMPLGGRTVLEHVLVRCRAVPSADLVVLATSDLAQDDIVAREGARLGVMVFRGDEHDVLSRYHGAAHQAGATEVLRVTADCPLIDPEVCDSVILRRRDAKADYACNFEPKSFPHGLDCEAFTIDALDRAQAGSIDGYQREHVTVWLIENSAVTKASVAQTGPDASHHRWTLDTPDDYRCLSMLFDRYPGPVSTMRWRELLQAIERDGAGLTTSSGTP